MSLLDRTLTLSLTMSALVLGFLCSFCHARKGRIALLSSGSAWYNGRGVGSLSLESAVRSFTSALVRTVAKCHLTLELSLTHELRCFVGKAGHGSVSPDNPMQKAVLPTSLLWVVLPSMLLLDPCTYARALPLHLLELASLAD